MMRPAAVVSTVVRTGVRGTAAAPTRAWGRGLLPVAVPGRPRTPARTALGLLALLCACACRGGVALPTAAGGWRGAVTLPGRADPSCESGLEGTGALCCAKRCGSCGGHGCGKLPGGAQDCCRSDIEKSGRHCASSDPPCMLTPPPGPPGPPAPAHRSAAITLDTASALPLAVVDPKFVSFTLDSSAWRNYDLSGGSTHTKGGYGGLLDKLVGGLHPAHLRVGGTQGDYDVYTGFPAGPAGAQHVPFPPGFCARPMPPPMGAYRCKEVLQDDWTRLLAFSQRNNLTLTYGLNDMFGRPSKEKPEKKLCGGPAGCPARNQSNLRSLLAWTAAEKPLGWDSIYALELGNELNTCLDGGAGALAQAADFTALGETLSSIPGGWRPRLVGPDTHSAAEFQQSGVAWFAAFAQHAPVDHLTFHMYSLGNGPRLDPTRLDDSYLSPDSLDKCGDGVKALQASLPPALRSRLWAGETASANEGGQSGITDTYINGFWYLDQLGQLAALQVGVFLRQTLLSGGGYPLVELTDNKPSPLPDYWLAVLHTRLMGPSVLNVSSSAPDLRIYAHCSRDQPGVTLAYLNIALNTSVTLALPPALAKSARQEFVLTAGAPIKGAKNPLQSKQMLLNGALLALLEGGDLPPMAGRAVQGSTPLTLPASSYGFLRFPAVAVAACTGARGLSGAP